MSIRLLCTETETANFTVDKVYQVFNTDNILDDDGVITKVITIKPWYTYAVDGDDAKFKLHWRPDV